MSASLPAQYLYQEQPGLMAGPVVRSEGCITTDLDGDGDLDLVFANGYVLSTSGQAIRPTVLINRISQGLGFVDETAQRIPLTAIRGTLVIAFDIENDGDLDLLFSCNGPSQQRLYVNDGSGNFTDESVQRLGSLNLAVAGCAYGDVDQDGDYDLFLNDELNNGQLKLFLNDGQGNFTNVTATHVAPAPKSNQQDVVLFDVDNDFDLDVINIGKSFGQQVYFNDGTGRFLQVTTGLLPGGGSLSYEAEAADLDLDGDLDLAMLSVSGTTDSVLRNNLIPSGTLSFTSLTSALTGGNGQDDNEWAFVDADNDGLLDLINGSLTFGAEKLYRNNGAFSFARQSGLTGFSPVSDPTLDVAVGDLNGDGIFDVVTAQGEFGNFTNRAYFGSGPADTQPPRFVQVEQLAGTLRNPGGPWTVRATIQDSIVDDGETSVASAAVDYTVTTPLGVTMLSVPMRFVGGLLYRAELALPPNTLANGGTVSFVVRAVDHRGNTATSTPQNFALCGLQRYGTGLSGINTAGLDGVGATSPGDVATASWDTGAGASPGLLALALAPAVAPLAGGTLLVDDQQLLALVPIAAGPGGLGQLPLPIPAIPALIGLEVLAQAVFDVPLALSNGLSLVICP
ncbi:MAG: FG-GAP repeat domain-containing protein [Planctomycetota bacterium]